MNLYVEYKDHVADGFRLEPNDKGNAGIDLAAAGTEGQEYIVGPRENITIPTGVAIVTPRGYYGRVVMRSGMGFKRDLSCHIGTVDAIYRGELFVRVRNHGHNYQTIFAGERFAQLIIQPYLEITQIVEDDNIEAHFPTDRGVRGFGSSGY